MKRTPPAALLLLAMLAPGCGKKDEAPQGRPPVAVETATAVTRAVPVYIDQIGTARASESVQIRPQASGQITKRYFEDGQDVKAGDRLFDIDARPYKAALDSAKASLAQAEAQVAKAKIDFDRSTKLRKTDAIGQQEFENDRTAFQSQTAQVQAAQAAVETAEVDLGYTEIRSPIAGRIGQRLVDVGNIVTADSSTVMAEVRRFDPIYVDFTVPEDQIARVRDMRERATTQPTTRATSQPATQPAGLTVQAWLPAQPDARRDGRLDFLNNSVGAQSGTVALRGTLPNADRHFWPGQFVQVRLILRTVPDAVLVPTDAVQVGQDGQFVFVVKDDQTVDKIPITPGQKQGSDTVVETGLTAGQTVVTQGQLMLSPGAKVKDLGNKAPTTGPAATDSDKPKGPSGGEA